METNLSIISRSVQISYFLLLFLLSLFWISQVEIAANDELSTLQNEESTRALDQFKFAEGIRNRKFYDLAAIEYEKIVTNYPKFEYLPEVLFYWGECLEASNQNNEALSVFKQLRQRFPTHSLSHQATITVAMSLINEKKFEGAERLLLEIINTSDIGTEIQESAFYYLGEIHLQNKNLKESIDYFSKIASKTLDEKFHYRSFALLNLGYIYRDISNFEAAQNSFTSLIENKAVSDPVKAESIFQLGEIAFTQSDFKRAIYYYEMIMSQYPKGEFSNQARVNLGWAYLHLERYKEVQLLFNPSLSNSSADGESLYIYALSLKNLMQCEAALKIYQRIEKEFSTDPYRIFASSDGIVCLFHLDQIELCLKKISEFIILFPSHELTVDVRYLKGRCLLRLGKLPEAAQAFEEALVNVVNPWDLEEAALTQLAETYQKLSRFDQASKTYKRLLKFNIPEKSVKALMLSAECDVLNQKQDIAIKTYERVLAEYPNADEAPIALLYHCRDFNQPKKI